MPQVKIKMLLRGLASFAPFATRLTLHRASGSVCPRYCYSMWLRAFIRLHRTGLLSRVADVAEIGPGDSLGMGIAALLCGADHYYALDLKRWSDADRNAAVLDQLVELFRQRAPLPDNEEMPGSMPTLESYEFPHDILTDETIEATLREERIEAIRRSLMAGDPTGDGPGVTYVAPWQGTGTPAAESLDLVFSHAVLEHVDEIQTLYEQMWTWLRPGGLMSHVIDYKSHQLTRDWAGHWIIPEWQWKLARGRRRFLISRLPHSGHVAAIEQAGFRVVDVDRKEAETVSRSDLAPRFQHLTDEDLCTAGACIMAVKP